MIELTAKLPCDGLLPLSVGNVTAAEVDLGVLTLLMPYAGQEGALSVALKSGHNLTLPGPGRSTGREGCRALWFGRGQVLLMGPPPDAGLAASAAISDQSDGWACVELSGPGAEDVLARLVPVDLRAASFKRGHTARSLIAHMHGAIMRLGEDRFLLMVFRSMAGTLAHDLGRAMKAVR